MENESQEVVKIGGEIYQRNVIRRDSQHERVSYSLVPHENQPVLRFRVVGYSLIAGVFLSTLPLWIG